MSAFDLLHCSILLGGEGPVWAVNNGFTRIWPHETLHCGDRQLRGCHAQKFRLKLFKLPRSVMASNVSGMSAPLPPSRKKSLTLKSAKSRM